MQIDPLLHTLPHFPLHTQIHHNPPLSLEYKKMSKTKTSMFLSPPLFLNIIIFFLHSVSGINPSDLAALRQIKNSLTDIPSAAAPPFFSTWNFSPAAADPCSSFAGVTCSSSSRVTILSLGSGLSDSPGLAGTLSPAIADLSDLTQLILFSGIVTGPIPPAIGNLRSLRVISLTNNRLVGPIPAAIFNLPNLHTLDLNSNQFSGIITTSAMATNHQLKVLILSSNKLTGSIPRNLPPQLLHLDVSNNLLSGKLPPRLPASIRYLSVSNNRIWGPLPQPLASVTYLDVSMNEFSGPLPWSLFRPTVTSLLLQRNNFSGRVPPLPPWDPIPGSTIDLSHNSLTGELTAALAGAETLFLNNNQLNGAVPAEYAASVESGTMRTLYLQHNYLTGFALQVGSTLPDAAAVCASYNCMAAPPLGLAACPASAGDQLSRPAYQCSAFRNNTNSLD